MKSIFYSITVVAFAAFLMSSTYGDKKCKWDVERVDQFTGKRQNSR